MQLSRCIPLIILTYIYLKYFQEKEGKRIAYFMLHIIPPLTHPTNKQKDVFLIMRSL